jgi:hypothetical protein
MMACDHPDYSETGCSLSCVRYWVRGCTNCTTPPNTQDHAKQLAAAVPATTTTAYTPQQCEAALEKICPGVAHMGATCHQCAFNHTLVLSAMGCSLTGSPPPEIAHYCMPGGGGGGGVTHPAGVFTVEYKVTAGPGEPPPQQAGQPPPRRRLEEDPPRADYSWVTLSSRPLRGGGHAPWQQEVHRLPPGRLCIRFGCASGNSDGANFCALDSVTVSH